MLLNLRVPRFETGPARLTVRSLHVATGDAVAPGGAVLDLLVDFSAGAAFDCPPVSLYRLGLREAVSVRRLTIAVGDQVEPGAVVAILSNAPDDESDAAPVREARATFSAIVGETGWWDDPA